MLLFIFILIVIVGAASWFYFPAVRDTVNLKRQNARISAITKLTKRDMDDLARRQRKDGW